MRSLLGTPLLVIDTETGGFNHLTSGIIEIGAIATDVDWRPVGDAFEVKIAPVGFDVEPDAARVNGYNEADWRHAMSRKDALLSFQEWLAAYPTHLVVGYNVGFDVKFLEQESHREGMDLGLMLRRRIDVMRAIDFRALGTKNKRSLSACARALGIVGSQAHRALSDCRLLLDVMVRYNSLFGLGIEERSPNVADAQGVSSLSFRSLVMLGATPNAKAEYGEEPMPEDADITWTRPVVDEEPPAPWALSMQDK